MEKLVKTFGDFELWEIKSTGVNNTPYHTIEVRNTGTAKKHVIEIRLNRTNVSYNGEPVKHTFYNVYIAQGMRGETNTLEETKECADALYKAIEAAFDIKKYLFLNGWWKE